MTLENGTGTTRRKFIFTGLAGGIATVVTISSPAEATEETALGKVLAKTKSIPLRGGKIKGKYVITQPRKGVYRCFSSTCTHQGCKVSSVRGGTINCPCHGSKFSIVDGHVVNGPATRSLPRKKIKVNRKKGTISLA